MGSLFRFVDDGALFPSGGQVCHFCESAESSVYRYFGIIIHPDKAADPDLARAEPVIDELCAKCILGGHVQKEIEPQVSVVIKRFATDQQASIRAFHKTPDIPLFMQGRDWPMCCGDWCEFYGIPASNDESVLVPSSHSYWEFEPILWQKDYDLIPESLREISLFRCVECKRKFFIFQPT